MGFKENLKDELKFQGMLVKELADKSGVPKGTIDHYLAEKCTAPIAENAVKIAQALSVTVEYLVTGKNTSTSAKNAQSNSEIDMKICKKYYALIKKIDELSEEKRKIAVNIIEQCGELGRER